MPIVIKDVDWKQTENTLTIQVPLRGIHPSKTDIFYSKSYLKASFDQFFFEAFLSHPVNRKDSRCTLTANHIVFELVKNEPIFWTKLELDIDKAEKLTLKKLYTEEEHKRLQEECAVNVNKKNELKRVAVREQMALDAKHRETIENIKKDEKSNAIKQMHVWKDRDHKVANKTEMKINNDKVENKLPPIPPPRVNRTLNVTFTPREFPTPSRESRLEEENEWLQNQAEARRSVGFISEDIRPEEKNPQFLKAKGDEFLKNLNYLGAISAYSFGIKLNEKYSDLYVARAEAHLAVGNYNKTVQDCTKALELMKPEVPLNLKERALCIGRRGIALINLDLLKEGIGELKASLRLVPNEEFSIKLNETVENLTNINETI